VVRVQVGSFLYGTASQAQRAAAVSPLFFQVKFVGDVAVSSGGTNAIQERTDDP
jgi:hypothetical protein